MDMEFDREFAQMQDELEKVKEAQPLMGISAHALHDSREKYHRLASDFDQAEGTLNEGMGSTHMLIAEMTTATSAVYIGTGHRGENEHEYSKNALALLNRLPNEEDVTVGSS